MAQDKTSEEPFFLSMLPFAGLALLLILALLWRYVPRDAPSTPAPPEPPSTEEAAALEIANFEQMPHQTIDVSPADFALGPADAPVTVVEFSDFECPFCRIGAQTAREVLAKHPEDVRLVFKNFPIDTACHDELQQQLHPFACRAAVLARCAGRSKAELFWQTHDALFQATELSADVLERIPVELSIGKRDLESCMTSPAPLLKVKQDIALARKLGVTGTPTFFVNGRRAPEYQNGALLSVVEHVLAGPAQK
ncbi:MAG: DsbA family protein [Vicinamibacteria bacterium]